MIETSVMAAKAILMGMLMSNGPVSETTIEETFCMAQNIYYEARGESLKGKQAVGNVVLNRVDHKKYPDTICGVVYEAKRYSWNNDVVIPGQCQFSWYCDGLSDNPKEKTTWRNALIVAKDAYTLYKLGTDVTDGSMWYHAQNVSPNWRHDFDYIGRIDDHLFYRTKNYKKVNEKLTDKK